jgi:tetratricopeptide (TPR) repeat protein
MSQSRGVFASLIFGGISLLSIGLAVYYFFFTPSSQFKLIENPKKNGKQIADDVEDDEEEEEEDDDDDDDEEDDGDEDDEEDDEEEVDPTTTAHSESNTANTAVEENTAPPQQTEEELAAAAAAREAEEEAARQLKELKQRFETVSKEAEGYINNKNYAEAAAKLSEALSLATHLPYGASKLLPLYNNRSAMYEKLGKYDESLADISVIMTLDPSHMKARNRRARVNEAAGHNAAALDDYVFITFLERFTGKPASFENKLTLLSKKEVAPLARSYFLKQRETNHSDLSINRELPSPIHCKHFLENYPNYYYWRQAYGNKARSSYVGDYEDAKYVAVTKGNLATIHRQKQRKEQQAKEEHLAAAAGEVTENAETVVDVTVDTTLVTAADVTTTTADATVVETTEVNVTTISTATAATIEDNATTATATEATATTTTTSEDTAEAVASAMVESAIDNAISASSTFVAEPAAQPVQPEPEPVVDIDALEADAREAWMIVLQKGLEVVRFDLCSSAYATGFVILKSLELAVSKIVGNNPITQLEEETSLYVRMLLSQYYELVGNEQHFRGFIHQAATNYELAWKWSNGSNFNVALKWSTLHLDKRDNNLAKNLIDTLEAELDRQGEVGLHNLQSQDRDPSSGTIWKGPLSLQKAWLIASRVALAVARDHEGHYQENAFDTALELVKTALKMAEDAEVSSGKSYQIYTYIHII